MVFVKYFTELDGKLRVITAEFHSKVAFDFNRFVVLGLRGVETTKKLEEVVKMAASRDGYEGHRTFCYTMERIVHFYIRFRNAACAQKAIVYFRAMDKNFNADLVKNLLLTWYMIEMILVSENANEKHAWTTVYVDVQGKTKFSNPLSRNNARSLLLPFGCSRVIHSNETSPKFIKVLFFSMAEALGATIAIGRWLYYQDELENRPSAYRVRIVGKAKEAEILTKSGSSPDEAFKIDYFVPASEVDQSDSASSDDMDHPNDSFSGSKSHGGYSRSRGRERNNSNCSYPRSNSKHGSAKSKPESNKILNTLGEDFKLIVNIS